MWDPQSEASCAHSVLATRRGSPAEGDRCENGVLVGSGGALSGHQAITAAGSRGAGGGSPLTGHSALLGERLALPAPGVGGKLSNTAGLFGVSSTRTPIPGRKSRWSKFAFLMKKHKLSLFPGCDLAPAFLADEHVVFISSG